MKLTVNNDIIQDAVNIYRGVYDPLDGFLGRDDFICVVNTMRLQSGRIWPIPIVLDVSADDFEMFEGSGEVRLYDRAGRHRATLENPEFYKYNKNELAKNVLGTTDLAHPGVADIGSMKEYLCGGRVSWADETGLDFADYNYSPGELKRIFRDKGWKTIAAFQTRNVPHRGHEFLQKEVLRITDGLLIQPVIGRKRLDDFKDEYIVSSYELLIDKYFPPGKAMLSVLPLKMRYAGPREAVMHALIRKNFGCSHFVVGRDHAGAGNYYTPTAAQDIFDKFNRKELGIEIIKFGEVVYDTQGQKHGFAHEVKREHRASFSGTKLRQSIKKRQMPAEHLIRPEIYEILSSSDNTLVDKDYMQNNWHPGFILWLTGLSGSGKSTVADRVYEMLKERNMKAERLDGDVAREYLTRGLGFSREDRDENVRRLGFVANLLSRNGVAVVASFISPYAEIRNELKGSLHNFIEVFVNAPLHVCERRDVKGLYKRARAGEITRFTGIDDPYEEPEEPHIHLRTHEEDVNESVAKVVGYLREKGMVL